MKKNLFIILLFINGLASAQDTAVHFFIGLDVSPDYCFRKVVNNDITGSSSGEAEERNRHELPRMGYTAGMHIGFQQKKIGAEAGVHYSMQGYKSTWTSTSHATMEDDSAMRQKYNFNYLEVPFKATYTMGKGKVKVIASTGVTIGYLFYERTLRYYKYTGGSSMRKDLPDYIYNPWNIFLYGSVGVDMKLSEKMNLRLEPHFKYGLMQTVDTPVTDHLWSAGLNLALNFRLK